MPGLYYYSSGPVNNAGTIYMKGVVEVLDPVSVALELDVSIGPYSANHNTTSGKYTHHLINPRNKVLF